MNALAFFEKLKQQSIEEMIYVHYPGGVGDDDDDTGDAKDKRKKMNELLSSDAMASGLDSALESLPKADLAAISTELHLKPEEGKSQNAKHVLKKLLFEKATEEDELEEFFKNLSAGSAQRFVTALNLKNRNEVTDWITEKGLKLFLSQFAVLELQQWMGDIKLDGKQCASKKHLIDAFIHGKNAEKLKAKPKKDAKVSASKPDLAKGISAADAFNWYTGDELRDYLKKHNLATQGRLREVAKRVSDHLNGLEVKKKEAKGTKRKRGGPGKKKGAKKQKTNEGKAKAT